MPNHVKRRHLTSDMPTKHGGIFIMLVGRRLLTVDIYGKMTMLEEP
jgi:hypothetical protein